MENKEKKTFSVKEFFKSTAFKCIAVLLAIALVCGILLTFCNDLFEVTDEERLNRTLSKIYGQSVETEDALKDGMTLEFDNGEINSAYLVKDDGNYLVNASGTGGYYGSVACWVVVEISDNSLSGIRSVIVDKADNASEFTNRISEDNLEYFADSFDGEEEFTVSDWQGDSLHGGATPQFTMTAIVNAVNTAVEFIRSQLLGEVTEPDPFEGFEYTYYIDTKNTKVTLGEDNSTINYTIVTKNYGQAQPFTIAVTVGADKKIATYSITENGSTSDTFIGNMHPDILDNGKMFITKDAAAILEMFKTATGEDGEFVKNDLVDETLASGASTPSDGAGYSNFLCVYAALFAASNYDNAYVMALENSIANTYYIDMENTKVTLSEDGSTINYTIVTKNYGQAQPFTIAVTVGADKKIATYSITENGSTSDTFIGNMHPDILDNGKMFITKDAAAILEMFKTATGEDGEFVKNDLVDETLASGASTPSDGAGYSNFLCVYAALFAASNYDTYSKIAAIEQQKLNAQMSEIYGEEITVETVSLDGFTTTVENGTVNTVYKVVGTDNYIVNATGTGGFSNGTVTAWIVVKTAGGAVTEIGNMIIESNVGQSYMDRLDQNDLDYFKGVAVNGDFTVEGWQNDTLHGGATVEYTMTAIVNSVNAAKNFVTANLLTEGGENA